MPRRTKILATLGPGSSDEANLTNLIQAGVNVFRLNFSHGSAEEHTQRANTIRRIARSLNTPVGILCDMQGPKIRIGSFANDAKIDLAEGDIFSLDSNMDKEAGNQDAVYIEQELLEDMDAGDVLLLDDGRLTFDILEKSNSVARCKVVQGVESCPARKVSINLVVVYLRML